MNNTLSTRECIYQRLLGICWEYNQGIDPSVVTPTAGLALSKLFGGGTDDRPLFINCEGMRLCIDHSMQKVKEEAHRTERALILATPQHDSNFVNKLLAELGDPVDRLDSVSHTYLVYGHELSHSSADFISQASSAVADKEIEYIQKKVSSCYRRFLDGPKRLTSTPLIADGVFNARNLISTKKAFMWISLLLAEKTRARIMEAYPDNIFILAISLRGSPLAAAVWNLLRQHDPYIEIIDHIGPVHELLEDANEPLEIVGKNYFLLGDFILGGTELKVASSYAITHQSKLASAIYIGSLLDGNEYSCGSSIDAIVKLNDCIEDLSYSI